MKGLKLILCMLSLVVLSLSLVQGTWAQSAIKIGVVDVDYLLNNHPKAEEVRAQIRSFIQKQEQEVKKPGRERSQDHQG